MTDVDTADALLGDDSDDREDYDLGKEEEAKLLYGDDGEEDWKAELLEEEEQEDNHRDKFASERTQQQIDAHEATVQNRNNSSNRDSYQHRFNRGRGGGGRGTGRGRGRGYNNGLRIGSGKCYVNPTFLQGVKKPVQSVQPWQNPSRDYEPERTVTTAPFVGQQRFHHQPQQQHPEQCQPQYNQMGMNNQQFGPPMNQNNWQPTQQFHQPVQQHQQNHCDGSMPHMQPSYQPPIQQNHQYNQFPCQPHQQHQHQHHQPSPQQQYPYEFNQPQQPLNYQHQIPQQHVAPMYNQNQPPVQNMHMHHNPQQHPQQQMTPYFDSYPQNHNMNQNHPPVHQNTGFNPPPQPPPPQRPALLQRPQQPPLMLTHEGGQFFPRQQHFQKHCANFKPPHQNFHNNQSQQFRPRAHQQQFRPNFHQNQTQFTPRGNYRGSYNTRPLLKRRNDNWREDYNNTEYTKRRNWNNYNEHHEEENQEEYYEEEEEEQPQQQEEEENATVTYKEDPTPDIEEDEETKAYRLKIEEQKRLREEILAEKERKRKIAIMKKNGEVCDIPTLEASPPKEQQRPKLITRVSGNNPNLRVLTRSDGEKVQLTTGTHAALNAIPTITKVRIKPVVAPTKAPPTSPTPKLTTGFLSTRTVIAKDNSLLDTPVVVVRNLAASSSEPQLRKLCQGVGLVQNLEMSSKERQAKIRFKSVASAHAFYKKYQRHMLDLSMIQVELVPDKISAV